MPTINRKQINIKTTPYKHDKQSSIYYNSSAWRMLRNTYIATHPLCENCLLHERTTPADEVHHKQPFLTGKDDIERWDLFLNPNNLVALCAACHDDVHRQLNMGRRT